MGNQWFQFKQFLIKQDKTAMKVGTDGALLGAWAHVPARGKVLDVGTGTGLLALMVAQKNPKLYITALEIEENAFIQATENVSDSPWNDKVDVVKGNFIEFVDNAKSLFDMIICNPPFYQTKNPGKDNRRAIARHSSSLEIGDLIRCSSQILTNAGYLCLVIPAEQLDQSKQFAENCDLYLQRLAYVRPTPKKNPHRVLLQFGKQHTTVDEDEIIIEEFGRHQYSHKFKKLLEPFHLS